MWVRFASGTDGYLNLAHVIELRVNTVASDSHLIEARMSDGLTRALDNVGHPTKADTLAAIRALISGVRDADG
jgi:hypothetical protein